MIVIDSSALVEALIHRDTTGELLRARMAAEDVVHAPSLTTRSTAVLFSLHRAGKADMTTVAAVLALLPRLPIERHDAAPTLWRRMHNLHANCPHTTPRTSRWPSILHPLR